MENKYIHIPKFTTIKEIVNKNYSLSATQYKSFDILNKNVKPLSDFLYRELERSDLGYEVGSYSYIDQSQYSFIKTKALQEESYLLYTGNESIQNITPKNFVHTSLLKGDLIISKDSNVGEIVILDKDYKDAMLCGGLYKLPISNMKYYLLAFIKNKLFREQIDFLVPRGSTIRHGKTKFLECLIPLPNKNSENTIKYIELIMQSIVNKEIEIRKKHNKILNDIQNELMQNQKENQFVYSMPTIKEILNLDRMDSSLYSREFKEKEFLITNYNKGFQSLTDLGFFGVRGTSLENNFIKNRIDSDTYRDGFYELIIPTYISKYGTINKSTFIGTTAKLKTISQGDIVFGGEGYGKGKSFVVVEDVNNIATNYHGIKIVTEKNINLDQKVFIKCFLSYLREYRFIDSYGVGGNGGHLAPSYFGLIKIPNFPTEIENSICKLYHNAEATYITSNFTLNNFLKEDSTFNQVAGIYELDKSMKYLQEQLNKAISDIANDIEVKIEF